MFEDERQIIRLFLVGCPRSGTTLLQSMISSHPRVFSLPETHFFPSIRPRKKILRSLQMTDRSKVGIQKLIELGCDVRKTPKWPQRLLLGQLVSAFVEILDEKARKERADVWLEKTPIHLHYINLIERYIQGARFFHIIRDGKDTIASLYEVTDKFPERWGGRKSIDSCLHRWVTDVHISMEVRRRPNHTIVFYDALVKDPEEVLRDLCAHLGLFFNNKMVDSFYETFQKIQVKGTSWTDGAGQPIYKNRKSKFYTVLNDIQRSYVINYLTENNLVSVSNLFDS